MEINTMRTRNTSSSVSPQMSMISSYKFSGGFCSGCSDACAVFIIILCKQTNTQRILHHLWFGNLTVFSVKKKCVQHVTAGWSTPRRWTERTPCGRWTAAWFQLNGTTGNIFTELIQIFIIHAVTTLEAGTICVFWVELGRSKIEHYTTSTLDIQYMIIGLQLMIIYIIVWSMKCPKEGKYANLNVSEP